MFDYDRLFARLNSHSFPARGTIRMQDVMPGGDSHAWMLPILKDFIAAQGYKPVGYKGAIQHLAQCLKYGGEEKQVRDIILGVTLKLAEGGESLGGMTCYTEPPTSDYIPPFVFLNDNPEWFAPNQQSVIAAHEAAHLLTPAALRYHSDAPMLEAIAYTSECVIMEHFGLDCERDTARGLVSYKVDRNLYNFCVPYVIHISGEIIRWVETKRNGIEPQPKSL